MNNPKLISFFVIVFLITAGTHTWAGSRMIAAQDASGKWGFINKAGKYVIQPSFDFAYAFHEYHALVKVGKKWGVIDSLGNFAIPPTYDDTQGIVSDGTITFKKAQKWGVVSLSNKIILPFSYSYLSIFNEGFVVAGKPSESKTSKKSMDVSIVDKNAKIWLDFGSYQLPGAIDDKKWSLGKWPVVRDGWISLLYTHQFDLDVLNKLDRSSSYIVAHHVKTGLPLAEPLSVLKKDETIAWLPHFSNGVAVARQPIPWEAPDWQQWSASEAYFLEDNVAYEGVLYQLSAQENQNEIPSHEINWRRVEDIISGPVMLMFRNSPQKNYIVRQPYIGQNWISGVEYWPGDIVTRYKKVYEAQETHFSNSSNGPESNLSYWRYRDNEDRRDTLALRQNVTCPATYIEGEFINPFYKGYAIMKTSKGVKIIGKDGWMYNIAVNADVFDISGAVLAEGLIPAREKITGKQGYLDMTGKKTINFSFDQAGPFVEGIAIVSSNGKYGAIDKKGNWVIEPIFHALQDDQTISEELYR